MKITYTAPNRSHHYPYAAALHTAGCLHAFVSGFSRFSPRAALPQVGEKLKRHDALQNLYLASLKMKAPHAVRTSINRLSNRRLDDASFRWAKDSDVFLYYRTQGFRTTRRLRSEGLPVLSVMEEVNSHVGFAYELLKEEFDRLKTGRRFQKDADHDLRLRMYEEADCILCPSGFVRRSFMQKGFAEEKLLKVNFGFPPVAYVAECKPRNSSGTFRLLYVGQVHYRKGLRYAMEAFQKLRHPKKEFVVVGPVTGETGLEGMTVPQGVVFTGALKGDALAERYKAADVFVLPSLEEGLALVQGEAMAMGLPLLITTNTGGDDFITDGVEGFIVQPAQTSPLAERMQQMADDKALLQRMSAAALQAAQTLNSWDDAAESLVSQLRKQTAAQSLSPQAA